MSDSKKLFTAARLEKAGRICAESRRYSRTVKEFRVMSKKDFDAGWGKEHDPGCVGGWSQVRKTHGFVGVLTVSYLGKELYYATSDNDPVSAGGKAIRHAISLFGKEAASRGLQKVHDKYYVATWPHAW